MNNTISTAYYSYALTKDGSVIRSGDDRTGAGIEYHCAALTKDGNIVEWGWTPPKVIKEKVALPYDFLSRLNKNLKGLCSIPKYIKMEILEDYTGWEFRDLYFL